MIASAASQNGGQHKRWNHLLVLLLVEIAACQIIGPKSKPGEVIGTSSQKDVNKALDDVLKAAPRGTHRSLAISITFTSGQGGISPEIWLRSGDQSAVAADYVYEGQTSLHLFTTSSRSIDSAGLFSYSLNNTNFKVAVAWNVGSKKARYWFNVKVYPKTYATSEHMFNQMKDYAGPWDTSGWESRVEYGVNTKATLTSNIQAKMMVFIDSTGLDPEGKIESYIDCAWNMKWFGSYCWRECHNGGWCWVDLKCSSFADCQGEHPCYESCNGT